MARKNTFTVSGLTETELAAFRRAADLDGRPLSSWIRKAAHEKMERDLRLSKGQDLPAHLLGPGVEKS